MQKQAHRLSSSPHLAIIPLTKPSFSVDTDEMPPACAECKVKKCRCTHHAVTAPLAPEPEAKVSLHILTLGTLTELS